MQAGGIVARSCARSWLILDEHSENVKSPHAGDTKMGRRHGRVTLEDRRIPCKVTPPFFLSGGWEAKRRHSRTHARACTLTRAAVEAKRAACGNRGCRGRSGSVTVTDLTPKPGWRATRLVPVSPAGQRVHFSAHASEKPACARVHVCSEGRVQGRAQPLC